MTAKEFFKNKSTKYKIRIGSMLSFDAEELFKMMEDYHREKVKENELLHNISQRFISSADEITSEGLECGIEDLNITDRYEAMQYGFDQCKERTEEALLNVG